MTESSVGVDELRAGRRDATSLLHLVAEHIETGGTVNAAWLHRRASELEHVLDTGRGQEGAQR